MLSVLTFGEFKIEFFDIETQFSILIYKFFPLKHFQPSWNVFLKVLGLWQGLVMDKIREMTSFPPEYKEEF